MYHANLVLFLAPVLLIGPDDRGIRGSLEPLEQRRNFSHDRKDARLFCLSPLGLDPRHLWSVVVFIHITRHGAAGEVVEERCTGAVVYVFRKT